MALGMTSLQPVPTGPVNSRWRRIVTPIPVPESLPMVLAAGQGLASAALQAAIKRAFISAGSRLLDAARDITGKRKKPMPPPDAGAARADGGVVESRPKRP